MPAALPEELVEKYELAGMDERERGFNRSVCVYRKAERFRAIFQYETIRVSSESRDTTFATMNSLVHILHAKGYRQLRSRISFRGNEYCGSRELWTDHPDPAPRWFERLLTFFARS